MKDMDQTGLPVFGGDVIEFLPLEVDAAVGEGDPQGVAGRRHRRDPRWLPAQLANQIS
jgi:hypothetical protein